jgi:hypothetical protein
MTACTPRQVTVVATSSNTNSTTWHILADASTPPPANWTSAGFEPTTPPWQATSRGVFGTAGSVPIGAASASASASYARATFELSAVRDLSACLRAVDLVPMVSGGVLAVAVNNVGRQSFDARHVALVSGAPVALAGSNADAMALLLNGTNVVTLEFVAVQNASTAVFFGAALRLSYGFKFADAINLLPNDLDQAGFIAGYVLGPFVLLVVALIAICIMRRQVRAYGKESKRFIDV